MLNSFLKKTSISVVAAILLASVISQPLVSNAHNVEQNTQITDENLTITKIKEKLGDTKLIELNSSDDVLYYLKNKNSQTTNFQLTSYDTSTINIDDDSTGAPNITTNTSIPSTVDNSATKYFPNIMNQGELNSCNAFATVYYQLSYTVNKELNRDASLLENKFSPTWVYNMINDGLNNATYISDIMKIVTEIGVVSIDSVPVDTLENENDVKNVRTSKDLWMEASNYRVKEHFYIGPSVDPTITDASQLVYTDEDILAIKQALAAGEVLTCSTYPHRWKTAKIKKSDKAPNNATYKGETIITRSSGINYLAHRMTIVGYDDNIWVDINKNKQVEEGEKGAFKLANSWGTEEGNDGFIWMSYDALKIKSDIDTSKLRNFKRTCGLYNIMGINVDLNSQYDDCYAVLDIQTKDLDSINVTISATSNDGTTKTFTPAPFSNAMEFGLGPYSFNDAEKIDRGQFYIDLSHVIKGTTKENINNYTWNIHVEDSSEENEIIIHSVNIYNKSDDSLSEPYNNNVITLNNSSYTFKIGE